jgi:hypothetical protein
MNTGIQKRKETSMSIRHKLETNPSCERSRLILTSNVQNRFFTAHWHDSVMNNMKRRHLIISFSHHKEECVDKFSKFADVIKPTSSGHLKSCFVSLKNLIFENLSLAKEIRLEIDRCFDSASCKHDLQSSASHTHNSCRIFLNSKELEKYCKR